MVRLHLATYREDGMSKETTIIEDMERIQALANEILEDERKPWDVWLVVKNCGGTMPRLERVMARNEFDAWIMARGSAQLFRNSPKVIGFSSIERRYATA